MFCSTLRAAALAGTLLAGGLFAGPSSLAPALAQSIPPPLSLTPEIMDKYIAVISSMARRKGEVENAKTEAAAEVLMTDICKSAGFDKSEECTDAMGYIGVLFGGYNPRTKMFEHPSEAARKRIADIEADTRLSPEARARAIAQNREIITMVPFAIPPADIALMNRYRDRLLSAGKN